MDHSLIGKMSPARRSGWYTVSRSLPGFIGCREGVGEHAVLAVASIRRRPDRALFTFPSPASRYLLASFAPVVKMVRSHYRVAMLTMKQFFNTLLFRPRLGSQQFTLLLSVALVAVYNQSLWQLVFSVTPEFTFKNDLFILSFFVFLVALFNILLTLVGIKYLQKPVAIFIVLSAALTAHFMNSYGVVIDQSMIQNAVETDPAEVGDLLSGKMLAYVLCLGLLPALWLARTEIRYRRIPGELKVRTAAILFSVTMIGLIAIGFYKDYSSLFRNHRQIRHLIVPSNYLYYGVRYLAGTYDPQKIRIEPVGMDASLDPIWQQQDRKVVTVMVVGETARADNFSMDGYGRNTNPELSRETVLNFSDMHSCGTSTAVSVPCMFSDIGRDNYDSDRIHSRENVLDVLAHAGISVLWRDNNSGCKGVCDRVDSQSSEAFKEPALCTSEECYDEVMLNRLDDYLEKVDNNALIVLHQKGSHGPAYAKRYPPAFARFTPVCDSADLQSCSRQQIVNAYDNSILYTDHFLSQVIAFLKQRRDRYATAMVYVSDHGESLGEGNIYLHGLPYFMAPAAQTHVPFISWISPEYRRSFRLDGACLADKTVLPWSQDNLFHSLLGLLAVDTRDYNRELDIFGTCRQAANQGIS